MTTISEKHLKKNRLRFFQKDRDELQTHAKESITNLQEENRRIFNKKRKKARLYHDDDLVVIRRTQQAPELKLSSKYLGFYKNK